MQQSKEEFAMSTFISVNLVTPERIVHKGDFIFEVCPRHGEIVKVPDSKGGMDLLKVARIEHYPVPAHTEDQRPRVFLYAEFETQHLFSM